MIAPNLDALRAEARVGFCVCCDRPLPAQTGVGRKRKRCDDAECNRIYMRAAHRDHVIRRNLATTE